jgi:hypothetical protein
VVRRARLDLVGRKHRRKRPLLRRVRFGHDRKNTRVLAHCLELAHRVLFRLDGLDLFARLGTVHVPLCHGNARQLAARARARRVLRARLVQVVDESMIVRRCTSVVKVLLGWVGFVRVLVERERLAHGHRGQLALPNTVPLCESRGRVRRRCTRKLGRIRRNNIS